MKKDYPLTFWIALFCSSFFFGVMFLRSCQSEDAIKAIEAKISQNSQANEKRQRDIKDYLQSVLQSPVDSPEYPKGNLSTFIKLESQDAENQGIYLTTAGKLDLSNYIEPDGYSNYTGQFIKNLYDFQDGRLILIVENVSGGTIGDYYQVFRIVGGKVDLLIDHLGGMKEGLKEDLTIDVAGWGFMSLEKGSKSFFSCRFYLDPDDLTISGTVMTSKSDEYVMPELCLYSVSYVSD